jgi:Domain of unknown function (DUF4123)
VSELYAVVDAARDNRIYDLVHDALFPACLFATDVVSPMGRNAPYLVPVENAERLIEAWRSKGRGESWGIFLLSSTERARLRQTPAHLQPGQAAGRARGPLPLVGPARLPGLHANLQ